MMNESILIPFVPEESIDDVYWVYLEQVLLESEIATLDAVSELVDATFGVDPCSISTENSPTVTDTPVSTSLNTLEVTEEALDFLNITIQGLNSLSLCDSQIYGFPTGSYKVQLKVGRSHQEEPYKLQFTNGEVFNTSVVQEIFSKVYNIEDGTSLTLPFPLVEGFTPVYEFENVVMGPYGYQTPPIVSRTGRVLSWGDDSISGELYVSYKCIYDLVDVVVHGDEDGSYSDCDVLCFYHGIVEELSIQVPDDTDVDANEVVDYCSDVGVSLSKGDRVHHVTCYETVTYKYPCRCSPSSIHHYETVDVVVSCPNPDMKCSNAYSVENADGSWSCEQYVGSRTEIAGYVSCDVADDQLVGQSWYYEDTCCHAPSGALPSCLQTRELNPGAPIDEDVLSELVAKWGDNLSIIPVSPADGNCGYIDTVIKVSGGNCCDGVSALEYDDEESVEVIADNSSGIIVVTGGKLPLTVSVRGSGFYVDKGGHRDGVSNSRSISIYAENACGVGTITISDGCSSTVGYVRSTTGTWGFIPDEEIPGWFREIPGERYNVNTVVSTKGIYRVYQLFVEVYGSGTWYWSLNPYMKGPIDGTWIPGECGEQWSTTFITTTTTTQDAIVYCEWPDGVKIREGQYCTNSSFEYYNAGAAIGDGWTGQYFTYVAADRLSQWVVGNKYKC